MAEKEYIEREAMIQRLKNTPLFSNFNTGGIFLRDGVIDLVEKQPAADVVEVKHGEWVLVKPRRTGRNATYKCTCCGKLRSSYYNDVQDWEYCPCGAKMNEGLNSKIDIQKR